MKEQEVVDKLKVILRDYGYFPPELNIVNETRFREDMNFDSLDRVELCMDIEDKFEIEIPDETMEKITTFKEAVDVVMTLKGWKR